MAKSYAQLQQYLTFDEMMRFLDAQFRFLPDHRSGNALRYSLADVVKSSFAMFSLKSPSLLDFKNQTLPEESNLHTIYRIEGAIPCDNQMRGILDSLDPSYLRPIFRSCFERLSRAGVLAKYHYLKKQVIVSIDGVEHFSSTKVHCQSCTTRRHRNGKNSYHHSGLAAVLVHPEQKEVFPLDFEPILKPDGSQKNDCERNAAKRLCSALEESYPELEIILVEDALYANAPHIRQITGYNWKYVLNVKPDSHKSLEKQFRGREARGQVKQMRMTDAKGVQHYFAWSNELSLCESAVDVKVNYLLYEQTDKQGKVTRWTWVTNLLLNARSVERVMRAGRSRWKIENETFNTLKNQGYHFEHNYGHGVQHLASVLAMLMLLAFMVDQIQQHCSLLFRQVWKGVGTKSKLWFSMRNLFNVLVFGSMEALYRHMASLYGLQLE